MMLDITKKEMTIVLQDGEKFTVHFTFSTDGNFARIYEVTEKPYRPVEKLLIGEVKRPYAVMQDYIDKGWRPTMILHNDEN